MGKCPEAEFDSLGNFGLCQLALGVRISCPLDNGSEQVKGSLEAVLIEVTDNRLILGPDLLQCTGHDQKETSIAF